MDLSAAERRLLTVVYEQSQGRPNTPVSPVDLALHRELRQERIAPLVQRLTTHGYLSLSARTRTLALTTQGLRAVAG